MAAEDTGIVPVAGGATAPTAVTSAMAASAGPSPTRQMVSAVPAPVAAMTCAPNPTIPARSTPAINPRITARRFLKARSPHMSAVRAVQTPGLAHAPLCI